MRKTVVVADDHIFMASGIVMALENKGQCKVLSTASNGIEAIAMIKKYAPDCAVLDLEMPGANGLEVMLECRRWSPQTRIAFLTGVDSSRTLQDLCAAGADGIFLKSADPDQICQGIYDVACGKQAYSDGVQEMLDQAQQTETLTAREREVLIGLSKGLSNRGISDRLGLSPKTIDSHRTSLLRKMDVNSTAQLLVKAMRDGLI